MTYSWEEEFSGTKEPFGGTIPNVLMSDLNSALANAVTPKKYGAKGNGSADDTQAMKDLFANEDKIFIPRTSAYYSLTEALVLRSGQTVLSDGATLKNTRTASSQPLKSALYLGNHHPFAFDSRNDSDITTDTYARIAINAVTRGDYTVTCTTAADAAAFTAGDAVFVRTTTEVLNTGYSIPDLVQLTFVISADSGTGVIVLTDQIERSIATGGYISKITGIDAASGSIAFHAVRDVTVSGLILDADDSFATRTCAYNCDLSNIKVVNARQALALNAFCKSRVNFMRGTVKNKIFDFASGSYGSVISDAKFEWVTGGTYSSATHVWNVSEQSFRMTFRDIDIHVPSMFTANVRALNIGAGWRHKFINCNFQHFGSGAGSEVVGMLSNNQTGYGIQDVQFLYCHFAAGANRTRYVIIGNSGCNENPYNTLFIGCTGQGALTQDQAIRVDYGRLYRMFGCFFPDVTRTSWFSSATTADSWGQIDGWFEYISVAPTTSTWTQGDRLKRTNPGSGVRNGQYCTTTGTLGTLTSITATTTNGSAVITVNSISTIRPGQWITIAGVTGNKQVLTISGTTVTLTSTCDASVAGAAVAYVAAVFKGEAVAE